MIHEVITKGTSFTIKVRQKLGNKAKNWWTEHLAYEEVIRVIQSNSSIIVTLEGVALHYCNPSICI